jgi:hypothetical protein
MTLRLLRWLACAIAATALLPGTAPAAGARTLVITGRIADAEHAAIRGARVFIGSRAQPIAITDATGRYSVPLFIGSLAGLVQSPYHETLRASLKGLNLSPGAGVATLALEIRVVQGSDGAARLRVQSNDPALADSVAHALVSPGSAAAIVTVDFLGRRGTELSIGPVPLTATSEVALPLADAPAGLGLPPFVGRSAAQAGVREGAIALPESSGSSASRRTPPRERTWRLFPSADELLADRPSHRDTTPAPAPRRVVAPSTTRVPPVPRVSGTSTRAPAVDSTVARRVIEAPPVRVVPPPVAERVTRVVTPPPATAAPARDARKAAPSAGPARETKPAIAVTVAPALPATGGNGSTEAPEYSSAIRVWGGRTVPRPPQARPVPAGSAACTCHIKGTVEVHGKHPLKEHVQVVVFVADMPALRDTVDLFMGSPREFDLHDVPCGARRIQAQALSRRRIALVSDAPAEEVPCGAGRVRELRLVLESR